MLPVSLLTQQSLVYTNTTKVKILLQCSAVVRFVDCKPYSGPNISMHNKNPNSSLIGENMKI